MSTHQHRVDIKTTPEHPTGIVVDSRTGEIIPKVCDVSVQLTPGGIPTARIQLLEIGLDLREVHARVGVTIAGKDWVLVDPDTIVYNDLPSDEILVMRGQSKPAAAALTALLRERGVLIDNKISACHEIISDFYKTVLSR